MAVTIRNLNLTVADVTSANEVLQSAYGFSGSRERALARYLKLEAGRWFLAQHQGRAVGMVGGMYYGTFGYVGMLGVLPDVQKQGVGRLLMNAVTSFLRQQGAQYALLDATDAGYQLYQKLAFKHHADTMLLRQRHKASADLMSRYKHYEAATLSPMQTSDLSSVAAFDAPYFGANRQTVLSTYLNDYPERCFILRTPATLLGYCVVQEDIIGPLVAQNHHAAMTLLRHALTLEFIAVPTLILQPPDEALGLLLRAFGFVEASCIRHMVLPLQDDTAAAYPARERARIYGQSSYAIG